MSILDFAARWDDTAGPPKSWRRIGVVPDQGGDGEAAYNYMVPKLGLIADLSPDGVKNDMRQFDSKLSSKGHMLQGFVVFSILVPRRHCRRGPVRSAAPAGTARSPHSFTPKPELLADPNDAQLACDMLRPLAMITTSERLIELRVDGTQAEIASRAAAVLFGFANVRPLLSDDWAFLTLRRMRVPPRLINVIVVRLTTTRPQTLITSSRRSSS